MKARNMLIAVFVAAGMLTYSTSWAAIEEIVVTATKRALAIQ